MATKAIIFDLYGVLGLNGWQAFKQLHFGERPEAWEHLRALGQQVDAGEASEQALVSAVAVQTGEPEATVRYQFEHTLPNEALLEYVQRELKPRYKIGLLSNASRDVLSGIFSVEQRGLFDVALSSFHVGLTKPDPRMFLLMTERLGVRPDECVLVDDQQRHLAAAAKLGFTTIAYESVAQVSAELGRVLHA